MDKKNNKDLKRKYAEEIREKFVKSLPFSPGLFRELFDYLDAYLQGNECDDMLKNTCIFLRKNNLPLEESLKWMQNNGAFCDCEVLANLEDSFEGLE